jgi:TonB family protein
MILGVSAKISRCSKRALILVGTVGFLSNGSRILAQNAPIPFLESNASSTPNSHPKGQTLGVEVLTDTRGVDFGPYIKQLIQKISESRFPIKTSMRSDEEGSTLLRFTIDSEGKVTNLYLDESSHDGALDHAAWDSIAQAKVFPPLPKSFSGPNLSLRVRYSVSRAPGKTS